MGSLLRRQRRDVADDEHQHADADERDDPRDAAAAREIDDQQLDDDAPSSKAAPTTQGMRTARAAASHIVTSAIAVHSSVMPVCTASEPSQASTWYGTPP